MSMRDFLNNNSALVTILAVVLLIVALGFIVMQLGGGSNRVRTIPVYYYDLDTGEIFERQSDVNPPVETAGGEMRGVRAFMFACNDCSDESDRFIGYLEMFTPEAKELLDMPTGQRPDDVPYDFYENGRLVRLPDGTQWYPANSPQGFEIMNQVRDACPGGDPKPCYPGM